MIQTILNVKRVWVFGLVVRLLNVAHRPHKLDKQAPKGRRKAQYQN